MINKRYMGFPFLRVDLAYPGLAQMPLFTPSNVAIGLIKRRERSL